MAMEEELGKFKERGWIRPSSSEWATVALVVPKKDGKMRVGIDYRDLNAISAKDAYPLPRIDELLNRLANARWFTKMDLQSGFHQIPYGTLEHPIHRFSNRDTVGRLLAIRMDGDAHGAIHRPVHVSEVDG